MRSGPELSTVNVAADSGTMLGDVNPHVAGQFFTEPRVRRPSRKDTNARLFPPATKLVQFEFRSMTEWEANRSATWNRNRSTAITAGGSTVYSPSGSPRSSSPIWPTLRFARWVRGRIRHGGRRGMMKRLLFGICVANAIGFATFVGGELESAPCGWRTCIRVLHHRHRRKWSLRMCRWVRIRPRNLLSP